MQEFSLFKKACDDKLKAEQEVNSIDLIETKKVNYVETLYTSNSTAHQRIVQCSTYYVMWTPFATDCILCWPVLKCDKLHCITLAQS
jgi:hypothetical protein